MSSEAQHIAPAAAELHDCIADPAGGKTNAGLHVQHASWVPEEGKQERQHEWFSGA